MDVLWFRVSRQPDDPPQALGNFNRGKIMVMLNRGDYWQLGFVIPKGGFDEIRKKGLDEFQASVVQVAPVLAKRVNELHDWNDIKLLTVRVDRLRQWYRPGLLCIGDAAHAMSPLGGVGINIAIQDAVAAANILHRPLLDKAVTVDCLRRVQKRREFPARLTQRLQLTIQSLAAPVLGADRPVTIGWPIRLLQRVKFLRRIPGRLVGMGFRPEHVKTPSSPTRDTPAAPQSTPHP